MQPGRETSTSVEKKGFDYIIIGAGAAGCLIANRLSADPAVAVALIEAGPSDQSLPVRVKSTLPIGNIFLLSDARYNWQHLYSGGEGVNAREIPCPRGKLVGGCTSVNGAVYMRGHRSDYDGWSALGNEGWSYDEVLPVFTRHENRAASTSIYHGVGGELNVERPATNNPLAHAFVAAAIEAGHPGNDDFNGERQDGFGIFELNQQRGERVSSARAFLRPAIARANLQVFTDTLVERINVRGGRAVGVTVLRNSGRNGAREELAASSEVVLSAGAVNSPQLLMLSGIGAGEELKRHGIRVVHELPGVGANLQDHASAPVSMEDRSAQSYALSLRSAPRIALAPLRYLLFRKGLLASNGAEAGGFLRSAPGLDRPDVQMTFMVGIKGGAYTIPRRHGFLVHVSLLRPASRGQVELASKDPGARPRLRPQFLESRADVDTLVRGVKEARRIFSMPALARLAGAEINPGYAAVSDAEIEANIRAQVATIYHPAGTCKMGPAHDAMAVVDAKLRVHGIEGLRVADASIMPNITSGNTAAPTMMIAEQAAAFILAARRSAGLAKA